MARKPLILLDRDGVLNEVVIDPEHGRIDSPLYPDQVRVPASVPITLLRLCQAGYGLCIVTNQPAAAKGKTTLCNLQDVHETVLRKVQAAGAKILSSHICYHRQEDRCGCRKPATGLLENALALHHGDPDLSWMVGDGVTDIQAGRTLGLKTAFLGPKKCDGYRVFQDLGFIPTFWGRGLQDFASFVLEGVREYGEFQQPVSP